MSRVYDVIIVGAGIVGAACAYTCAKAGLRVLVLDRGPVSGGTTSTGMGHIVVMDDSEAQFALTAYSRKLWHKIESVLPESVEFDNCGTLWVAADAEEMLEVERKHKFYSDRGIKTFRLDEMELYNEEPQLRKGLAGGLCVPDDIVIYPPTAATFFLEEAIQDKAEVQTQVEVNAVLPQGGVCLNDGSEIHAGIVIIAAGCDSPDLVPEIPIRKRKGHLVITERYPQFARHQIIELGYLKSAHSNSKDSVAFNLQPRKTGQLLIGSSRQFDNQETDVDFDVLRQMLIRVEEYMPDLNKLSVLRCWTGFRPTTPDKLPVIGPHPQQDRLWLATGHEGLGIATSLGTGQVLADMLMDQVPAIPVEPYLPERLGQKEVCDD